MTDFHEYLESLMRDGIREAENMLMAEREGFAFPTARPQWAPPRHYNILHLKLEWKMDPGNEHVDAVSSIRIESIAPELKRVFLHATELMIERVTDKEGHSLRFEMMPDEQAMSVDLTQTLNEREIEELTFVYSIDHPRTGLYFTNRSPQFPDVETSAWTQMQDDYARYCVPVYDNPSHKFPVEAVVTVPKGFFAMSNGYLRDRSENSDCLLYTSDAADE